MSAKTTLLRHDRYSVSRLSLLCYLGFYFGGANDRRTLAVLEVGGCYTWFLVSWWGGGLGF